MAIGLPGQQQQLVSAVLNATRGKGKPIVAVLVNGGLVSLDSLVAVPPSQQKLAIVEALLPGNTGANALANALWGKTNCFGKLPFT
jgi:beta-glucosidase|eukprot:SAG25_NODE_1118_length_3897_cov_1.834387_6_plen_86_part_00